MSIFGCDHSSLAHLLSKPDMRDRTKSKTVIYVLLVYFLNCDCKASPRIKNVTRNESNTSTLNLLQSNMKTPLNQ